MKNLYLILAVTFSCLALGQTGISVPEMTSCDTQIQNLLTTFNIPGLTMAISKDGKLIYERAFGNANLALNEPTQPYHLFRIASVSKPITSITIMKMIENGQLNLSDTVFGPGGLLENHWYLSTANITDSRIYDITVQQLLEHSAGFNRDHNCFPNPTPPYPYYFAGCDPISAPLHVTQTLGEPNPVTEEMLITFLLEKGLDFTPGTQYSYSNIGYLILGEIIEEISGMSYEDYVTQTILHPLGIYDMHLGKNLLMDKMEREGEYKGEGYTNLSIYGTGEAVPWEYGGFNLEAFDAHGGWIATARDMVRLLVAVDGFATSPDILNSTSITTMVTPSATEPNYAKGWQVNQFNNWWHTGAVDGTACEWVRSSNGYTWAIILNKRLTNSSANAFWSALDNLGWNCIGGMTSTPTHDFFDAPVVNASNLVATNVTDNSMDLSWTNGDGTSRIVVAKEVVNPPANSGYFKAYPLDGNDYTANAQFGMGTNLGDNTFVVYKGTGNSVSLQNLNEDTEYVVRVYEFTKQTSTGNNALYMLGNAAQLVQSTTTLGIDDFSLKSSITIHPTVVDNFLNVTLKNGLSNVDYSIYDTLGSFVSEGNISNSNLIEVTNLQSGLYMIQFKDRDTKANFRFVKK
ncbi:MAG: serine hydrolase [Gelidibacter sp.]